MSEDVVKQFTYLLNAMEVASQAENPADHGFAAKRKAVLDYVRGLAAPAPTTEPRDPLTALYNAGYGAGAYGKWDESIALAAIAKCREELRATGEVVR